MKRVGDVIRLEMSDLIRANQLIRGKVDRTGFIEWFDSLDGAEQCELAMRLAAFACEAGFDQTNLESAEASAAIAEHGPVIQRVREWTKETPKPQWQIDQLRIWFSALPANDRRAAFILLACLFGEAEGRVFANETVENCNHWWHRNLQDPRVVEDLLSDPNAGNTSMRDDERVKRKRGGWWPF
jgi:hypothetical protein